MLMGASQGSRTVGFDGAITGCDQLGGPRFCLQRMVNSVAFGASAMKITGLGTDRLRLKLRIMSDDDLWWLFLNHRHECSQEFWERIGNSKSRWYIIQRKPLVHYPTTVHSGRWASSQNTV